MRVRNILVDWGGQSLLNMGDLAMAMVAVERLREHFPDARIRVTTYAPDDLPRFCQADGLSESILQSLFWRRVLPGMVTRAVPALGRWEEHRLRRQPLQVLRWRAARHLTAPSDRAAAAELLDQLATTDLVLAAGGGYLTDAFEGHVLRFLDLLQVALDLGKPVALMGQGLGPMVNPVLRNRTRQVLRRATVLTLREPDAGPAFLQGLDPAPWNATVTGDDAIGMVRARAKPVPGTSRPSLGLNIRVARYAEAGLEALRDMAMAVAGFAESKDVRLRVCPIDFGSENGDAASVGKVLSGHPALDTEPCERHPYAVIRRVAECRVVTTGSYHAAVFALSQGIPAICLAQSAYYQHKFNGLAVQFGPACTVVRLDVPGARDRLLQSLEQHWSTPDAHAHQAQSSADAQVAASQAAYQRLADNFRK